MTDIPKPQKLTLEEVQTGSKPFQLFPFDKTQKRIASMGKTYIYDRIILLNTDDKLPHLPIKLYAGATQMSRSKALSPYTDDGSQLAGEDIDYAAAQLCLDATLHNAVLRNMKLTKQTQTFPDPLLPEVKEALSRLRFHVSLPRRETLNDEQPIYDTFEARPDETALILGELSFRHFTPQEPASHSHTASTGYFLMLPSDDKIIQKIKGQFIMIPLGKTQ
jgi:hypothetical protein